MDTTRLPKIDLHRHLEGSVRPETVLELARMHGVPLPAWELEHLLSFIQVTEPQPGVMAFIAKFRWITAVLIDPQTCYRVAYEAVSDARQEDLDYLELRFSPWFMAEPHGLDPVAVVSAVVAGVQSASRDHNLPVNLIGILSRTYGPDIAWHELEALLSQRDQIVALDLAGDEANFPGDLFVDHFRRAREAGWRVTVHAGEAAGPSSIWQAIRELGATRIGHAVHAGADAGLVEYLAEHRIAVEANLTSNLQTSTIKDYPAHPLQMYLESGVLASINSDDPRISGIDLQYEYDFAAPAAGLSAGQVVQARWNALESAFLTDQQKQALFPAWRG